MLYFGDLPAAYENSKQQPPLRELSIDDDVTSLIQYSF